MFSSDLINALPASTQRVLGNLDNNSFFNVEFPELPNMIQLSGVSSGFFECGFPFSQSTLKNAFSFFLTPGKRSKAIFFLLKEVRVAFRLDRGISNPNSSIIMCAFVPPNPKELTPAARMLSVLQSSNLSCILKPFS